MRDSNFSYYMGRAPVRKAPTKAIRKAFDRDALKRICEMHEDEFYAAYDMELVSVNQRYPDDYYCYLDRGSDILFVAHLDTVVADNKRLCQFLNTAGGGEVVYSGALDDRLGAYTGLELLPKLGLNFDVLLTVGEESGRSTAQFFDPPKDKDYKWGIEFDRGGTDVVMYQYENKEMINLVRESGARVGDGSFSDIAYLEHLGAKMFNWGIGYRDYHGPRGHAYLDDTFQMIAYFLNFHEDNKDSFLSHVPDRSWWGSSLRGSGSIWDNEDPEVLTEEEILDALADSTLDEDVRQQMEEILDARSKEAEDMEADLRERVERFLSDGEHEVVDIGDLVSDDPVEVSKALVTINSLDESGIQ